MKMISVLRPYIFIVLVWYSVFMEVSAQNLAPNPSFEVYSPCPIAYGNGGILECAPWINGNQATADYFNECAIGTDVWIPDNWFGSQSARTGSGYAGFYTRESSIWREYIQAPLLQPLTAGITYHVSFYVSLADLFCPVANIGAYLSATPPPGNDIGTFPGVIPQIQANLGFINEANDWVLIAGCFVAVGGEQYITIGNFYNNANTPLQPGCTTSYASYYYIDDVSVTQGDPAQQLNLDLGDDVNTCGPYEINPGISGVDFHWSTGSSAETITVTQSGTYKLTITLGCAQAIDSIHVVFDGAPPVDVGPAMLTLCEGENYTITLDPNAGDYEWQDGSVDPEYVITTSGLYEVTLDDGCDITTDTINVIVVESPPPFSLGNDAFLCNGDDIVFSFDPALGNFLWQDGSTSPVYTIISPGNYSLTISNQCGSVSDDILVTTGQPPTVDLGPAQMSLCDGQDITIQLDPNAGDYEWQDGSTSSTYIIAGGGSYSVTVTNGCGSSSDQINVVIVDLPAPFSLGADAVICSGEELFFSFDPGLGDFLWQDQSTASDITVNSGGIYSLTISNSCGEVSDTILIQEIAAPDVDLGADQVTICEGQSFDIVLDPDLGDFAWQDGSTSSTISLVQPGLYSVTVSNQCGAAMDQVEAILIESPEFDFGNNIVLCPAQLPVTLDVSDTPNAASFQWQDNSTNPIFLVTTAGTYSVTISNQCFSISDQVDVIVQDASPDVALPPDQTLCQDQTLLLDGNGLIGSYTWQDGSNTSSFTIDQPGTYALTVSNQCGSDTDSITIQYTNIPSAPDLGPDVNMCPGEQLILHANVSGATYSWQDMSTADSLIVASAGTYILSVSNHCGAASDTIMVTVGNNPPVVNLPSSLSLCTGEELNVAAGVSGVQYLWSDGSQTSSITIAAPGLYSITVSNSCGVDVDSIMVTDAGTVPGVSLDDTLTMCEGGSLLLIPQSTGVLTWRWQDGSTASDFNVTSGGLYSVQVSNNCGSSADSVVITTISSPPQVDLGNDTMLCPGQSVSFFIGVPDMNITWFDGSTSPNFTVHDSGVVFVNLTNQCGSTSDTIAIALNSSIPILDLGPDQSLCPGETIIINPGFADVQYLWQDGSTGSSMTVTIPGNIILSLSNVCGNASDTLQIIVDTNGPALELGPDILACKDETVTIQSNLLGVQYLWQDGTTTPDFVTSSSGTFILQVSNACGIDVDTVHVFINGDIPVPELGPDTLLCEGSALQLFSNADANTSIQWQDGSTSHTFTVTQEGIYFIVETNHCGNASDSIEIRYQNLPLLFDLGPDTTICAGDFLILSAPVTSDVLSWQDGSQAISIVADEAKIYSLTISNACGKVEDDLLLSLDTRVPVLDIGPDITLCTGDRILLDVTQAFPANYIWSTGENNSVIEINQEGHYIVTVSTLCQTAERDIQVTIENCTEELSSVFIPNIFSPNEDQVNDEFSISVSNRDILALSCSIFDRWGNQVFNSNEPDFKWNGTFKNALLSPGVFVYIISMEWNENGKRSRKLYSGDVTLVL